MQGICRQKTVHPTRSDQHVCSGLCVFLLNPVSFPKSQFVLYNQPDQFVIRKLSRDYDYSKYVVLIISHLHGRQCPSIEIRGLLIIYKLVITSSIDHRHSSNLDKSISKLILLISRDACNRPVRMESSRITATKMQLFP